MLQVPDYLNSATLLNSGPSRPPIFIDAFAGCGGLSLGLMRAGWQCLFAIEKDKFAFETLKANFLQEDSRYRHDWPSWLPQAPLDINEFIENHQSKFARIRGRVDLLAGGPPCQGFSSAGKRNPRDPRNKLVNAYLKLVHALEPDMVLLENVRGITSSFASGASSGTTTNYSERLVHALEPNYIVFSRMLRASTYGVPQKRPRYFLIALRKNIERPWPRKDPFVLLKKRKKDFLLGRGFPLRPSSRSALSDLELHRNGEIECPDSKGYAAIGYKKPRTAFQTAMRDGFDSNPSDTRLARHRPHIVERFSEIIDYCLEHQHLNTSIPRDLRESFGIQKQAIRVLDPRKPAPTITSMPDDLLHYSEPRTLTVRENARLQTFPDWFEFKGKYTTGGDLRRSEVPRFTQVANAVPPLLAELLGICLLEYLPE
ncbi:MAG: DNA cytosine methyltransferase [Kiloniellaceae bacterium]